MHIANPPLTRALTPRSWRAVASFMPEAVPHAAARTVMSIFFKFDPTKSTKG